MTATAAGHDKGVGWKEKPSRSLEGIRAEDMKNSRTGSHKHGRDEKLMASHNKHITFKCNGTVRNDQKNLIRLHLFNFGSLCSMSEKSLKNEYLSKG